MASETWHRCPSAKAKLTEQGTKVEGYPIKNRNSGTWSLYLPGLEPCQS